MFLVSMVTTAGREVGVDSEGRHIRGGPGQNMDGTGEAYQISELVIHFDLPYGQ